MKVTHVSRNLCPRIIKLAYCQQQAGIETHWVGEIGPTYQETLPFKTITVAEELRFGGFQRPIIEANKRTDLFHAHVHLRDENVLERASWHMSKPLVIDLHDRPEVWSNKWAKHAKLTSRISLLTETQGSEITECYYSFCPKDWFPVPVARQEFPSLVVATGLSDRPGHAFYWLETFKALQALQLPVTCYTGSRITQEYAKAANMRLAVDVKTLIKQMANFTAGLCGSLNPDKNTSEAISNKLFEYVAAGIPAICLGAQNFMANWVTDYKLGIVVDAVEEIPSRLPEIWQAREWIPKIRDQFTMDYEAKKVSTFYQRVLQSKEPKTPHVSV